MELESSSNDRYEPSNHNLSQKLPNVVKVNNSEQLKDFIVNFLEENNPTDDSTSTPINLDRAKELNDWAINKKEKETSNVQTNSDGEELSLVESKALSKLDQIRAKLSSFLQASQNDTSMQKSFAPEEKQQQNPGNNSKEINEENVDKSYMEMGGDEDLQTQEESQIVEVYVNGNLQNVANFETPEVDAQTSDFYSGMN